MAADKITYSDKVGIIPKDVQINQVWDDDMNEIKLKVNNNADLHDTVSQNVDVNTLDIADLQTRTANVTVSHPVLIPFDFPLNTKTDLDSIHGSLLINGSEDGIILNSSTPIIGDGGVSKVMCSVIAGTVTSGTLTITGTSVDRDTGVETASDTENITISGLTTNGSTTDANGNTIHSYTNAYISSKWWRDSLTFSTTDLDITEIRFAQLSFEQFDDTPNIVLDSFDAGYIISNSTAIMDAYLYSVIVTGSSVDITNVSSLNHATGELAGAGYRRRKGNINTAINGTQDGIFVDLYLGPLNQQYFSSFSMKIWATKTETVNINFL